jgi:hypothetical protein
MSKQDKNPAAAAPSTDAAPLDNGAVKPDSASAKSDAGTVRVLFKNTCVGEYGIFYRKNQYTIAKKLAEIMKEDLEVLKEE